MKLAYLLKKFPRLSETFILTELLGQQDQGADLCVFSRRPPDDEPTHPELARLAAPVEVLPGRSGLDPWSQLFSDAGPDPAPEEWSRLGEVVRALRSLVGERLPRLVAEGLFVERRARELEVGHIHVHFATESAIVAWIVTQLGGPPYSITAHAKDIYRTTVRPELLDLLVGGSAFTVTVCDANVQHMRGLVSDEAAKRIRRVYNGLMLERFPFIAEGREEEHVLAVGRLVEKKGFDDLMRAVALLRTHRPGLRVTLVGDGDQREALTALRAELGLEGVLTLAGALDQGAVRELLARATLLALPCVIGEDGNRDALPTVLLEALASGLPCVSTPVTGVPEILDEGRAGLIVPEHAPEELAAAIGRLLDERELRSELAQRGRERALACFDARRSASTLADWFRESLATGTEPIAR